MYEPIEVAVPGEVVPVAENRVDLLVLTQQNLDNHSSCAPPSAVLLGGFPFSKVGVMGGLPGDTCSLAVEELVL